MSASSRARRRRSTTASRDPCHDDSIATCEGGTMLGNLIGGLFDGIAYGSLLFIISIGLSVTMGLMNFVNLAHGAFAMLGGYVCVMLLSRLGLPFLLALPLAFIAAAV